jgi:hypothetical protein
MKVFATGKWSKEQKRWSMVVAIRRPGHETAPARRKGEESTDSRPRRTR